MQSPAEIREKARSFLVEVNREPAPQLRRLLASHAFALAQLAEKIQRDDEARAAAE